MAQQDNEYGPRGDSRSPFVRSLWYSRLPNNLHAIPLNEGKYLLASATSEQSANFGPQVNDLLNTLTPLMPGEVGLIPLNAGAAVSLQIDRRPDSTIMISRNAEASYTVRGSAPMSTQLQDTDIFVFGSNPDTTVINATQILSVNGGEKNVLAIRRIITAEDEKQERQSYVLLENISQEDTVHVAGYTEQDLSTQEMRYVLSQGNVAGIEYATAAHIGLKRETQQDRVRVTTLTFPDGHQATFAIVADGMGGYKDGGKAAQICIDDLPEAIEQALQQQMSLPDAIAAALLKIHKKVADKTSGGGATLACAIADKTTGQATLFHVGDARTHIMGGKNQPLQQIGKDHSMVQEMIDIGMIHESQRRSSPLKNVVSRSIGKDDKRILENELRNPKRINSYIQSEPLVPNMRIILCSDGLWEMVEDRPGDPQDATNTQTILAYSPTPVDAVNKLTQAALAGGGKDNIGIVVLQA